MLPFTQVPVCFDLDHAHQVHWWPVSLPCQVQDRRPALVGGRAPKPGIFPSHGPLPQHTEGDLKGSATSVSGLSAWIRGGQKAWPAELPAGLMGAEPRSPVVAGQGWEEEAGRTWECQEVRQPESHNLPPGSTEGVGPHVSWGFTPWCVLHCPWDFT